MYQQGGMRKEQEELGTWERSQSLLDDRGQQKNIWRAAWFQELLPNSNQQFGNY
jgi:hypothetical protein